MTQPYQEVKEAKYVIVFNCKLEQHGLSMKNAIFYLTTDEAMTIKYKFIC